MLSSNSCSSCADTEEMLDFSLVPLIFLIPAQDSNIRTAARSVAALGDWGEHKSASGRVGCSKNGDISRLPRSQLQWGRRCTGTGTDALISL